MLKSKLITLYNYIFIYEMLEMPYNCALKIKVGTKHTLIKQ
jgi:hypothetical protein